MHKCMHARMHTRTHISHLYCQCLVIVNDLLSMALCLGDTLNYFDEITQMCSNYEITQMYNQIYNNYEMNTRLREIEVLLNVICIHQLMLPSKCFCFKHRCKTAAASLERLKNTKAVFTSGASLPRSRARRESRITCQVVEASTVAK